MSAELSRIVETDEVGSTVATYVQSFSRSGVNTSRIDIIQPLDSKNGLQKLLDVFLPSGYPHSVTEDYLDYQIYDSLQAFASSIAGLLASRAVLEGVGVGDATASTTAAVLLSILQESLGRVTTILFAYRLGTSLEPECKMYRLLADVFNDTAMILECLSPAFSKPVRVTILATSSALKALCGVAAGSSKASLSAHFARWGNLGELNAKDSSQETVISLLGMLAGSAVVSMVKTPMATWTTLILLLSVHLGMNYRAVRAVSMRSLNRQRANIVFAHLLSHDEVLTPSQVSLQERIFEGDGLMRTVTGDVMGRCRIGVSFRELVENIANNSAPSGSTASIRVGSDYLNRLLDIFKSDRARYIIWVDVEAGRCWIVLRQGLSVCEQIKAWYAAYAAMRMLLTENGQHVTRDSRLIGVETADRTLGVLKRAQSDVESHFDLIEQRLRQAGWDLDTAALETHSGTRIVN